jgi:hypothetical protein
MNFYGEQTEMREVRYIWGSPEVKKATWGLPTYKEKLKVVSDI